jgi:Xaa-Pro aminopeptidase
MLSFKSNGMIYTPLSTRYPGLPMLEQARQRTAEFQSRLRDGGISVDGRLGGRIGDSVAVTETGTEYITEYPRNILTVNR